MNRPFKIWHGRKTLAFLVVALASFSTLALGQYTLQQISIDNLTNSDSDHKTEVEPHIFSWGNTMVSAFHVARRPGSIGWGSGDIGFATSTDGGSTWMHGDLPGLTVNYGNGKFGAEADPAVAYDAKHGIWMIVSLPLVGLSESSGKIGDVGVSRSTDAFHWNSVVLIDKTALDDKTWIVCDNNSQSPYYGNCYVEWDQAFGTGEVLMSVSSNGGLTWTPGQPSSDHAEGLGGEPLVQPNGTVVVPFEGTGINAFTSTDGGSTWGKSVLVSNIDFHLDAGGIRDPDLPTADLDGAGNVYVGWADCRFRTSCAENDIVYSSSADGVTWGPVTRIPIDPVTSTVDHFLPGIGVDPTTSGTGGHLTVVYYYYPVSKCGNSCQLDVGFSSSEDGGSTWSSGVQLAGPMQLSWLPVSDDGPMVADYIAVSYNNGNPYGVFAVAQAPTGSTLHEATYTTKQPLAPAAGAQRFSSSADHPVPGAKSDHEMIFYLDDAHHRPIPQSKLTAPENEK